MLKKILFLILLFSTHFLLANDLLDDFIDEQIKVEAQFFDQNLSLDKKVDIKKKQVLQYGTFFLQYAADKEKNLQESNPYRGKISRLKLRLNDNKYRGNTNAVKRDEVLLKGYAARNMIRDILHDTLMETRNKSKEFFKDKVNEIIEKSFSIYKPLDKSNYLTTDQNQTSPIVQSINLAFQKQTYLNNVANTFSSELVENAPIIYRTARISSSKFLCFVNKVNSSPAGKKLNTYLKLMLRKNWPSIFEAVSPLFVCRRTARHSALCWRKVEAEHY